MRLDDIEDETERQRYKDLQEDKGDDAPVQLDCRACHRLDAGDFGLPAGALAGLPSAAVLPWRAAGGNPLPITYENQCRACHRLNKFDQDDEGLEAPHRVQPSALREFLERVYADRLLKDQLPLKDLTLRPDGRLERVTVRVGITDGAFTEIVSGELKEGDKVATDLANAAAIAAAAASRGAGRPGGIGRF